jgi:hypothetical protein
MKAFLEKLSAILNAALAAVRYLLSGPRGPGPHEPGGGPRV